MANNDSKSVVFLDSYAHEVLKLDYNHPKRADDPMNFLYVRPKRPESQMIWIIQIASCRQSSFSLWDDHMPRCDILYEFKLQYQTQKSGWIWITSWVVVCWESEILWVHYSNNSIQEYWRWCGTEVAFYVINIEVVVAYISSNHKCSVRGHRRYLLKHY